jgi:hypothetical protein
VVSAANKKSAQKSALVGRRSEWSVKLEKIYHQDGYLHSEVENQASAAHWN